ncbi:Alpha/Beta hydrolase protein [Mycena rosella]|uniref:Alpha/Beta hydrolase protein n=1 Tax=Mycena rosella TaxID=1033263 RepID=A0AAD7G9V6_MYCRO|nr:Alpha/Beta hydrolase protein [Mycena rosella]
MGTEKYLTLADGRTLAYDDTGDASSSFLVLYFHGVFGIGSAPKVLSPVLVENNAHYITPTLAGWGYSSPRPTSKSYAAVLASDMTELINYLHPNAPDLRIYIAGGSFGTVPAQMLYGAPFDVFPLGRRIAGCLIGSPFSPFKWDAGYTKSMTWANYLSVGPPARVFPFQLMQRLAVLALSIKFNTVDKAEAFLRDFLFDNVPPEEREAAERWRVAQGLEEGEFQRRMATNLVKSISKSWAGFTEVAEVLHADWGFCPRLLDDAHTVGRPIMITPSTLDELGPDMAVWLEKNYRNSILRWIPGKHLSGHYAMDDLWAELLAYGQENEIT